MNRGIPLAPPQPNPLPMPPCVAPGSKRPAETALDALYIKLAEAVMDGRDEEQTRLAGIISLVKSR